MADGCGTDRRARRCRRTGNARPHGLQDLGRSWTQPAEMGELRRQLDIDLKEIRAQQAPEIAELREQMGWGFGPEDDYYPDWY